MKILFHLPILPPKNPKFEAYSQEIEALTDVFDGKTIYINPNQYLPQWVPLRIPRLAFGWYQLPIIRKLDSAVDLHQVYNPDPYRYPLFSMVKKPVVYVLSGSLDEKRIDRRFFESYAAVAVYDERTHQKLSKAGIKNAHLVRSGVNTDHFTYGPLELGETVHLLMASAPWAHAHFESKGIDALLSVAAQLPQLRLTFLWRGVLLKEMQERVAKLDLDSRVTIIDEFVDVNALLQRVHGTVLVANVGDVVKAYPHSLIDSLAAGKPVIVSRTIPMSDYVEAQNVGHVVEEWSVNSILRSIQHFMAHYDTYSHQAGQHRAKDFTLSTMRDSYRALYSNLKI